MNAPRHARGFALIVVLWSLGVLALIGAQVTSSARAQMRLAAAARDSAIAEAAARGAIWHAMFEVRRGRWDPSVPAVHHIRIGEALIDVTADDGARKLNPNVATFEEMRALLLVLGIDPPRAARLAGAIADWRTRDPVSVLGGPKIEQYKAYRLPYRAADRPFDTLEEIGLLPGMSKEVMDRLLPRLTLFHEGAASSGKAAGEPLSESKPLPVLRLTAMAVVHGRARFLRAADVRVRDQPFGRGRLFQLLTWD